MVLSLVIPCYNEQANVALFYDTVMQTFADSDYSLELVFVNDGSSDQTLEQLKGLLQKDTCIKVIDFSRNFGKEAAMFAGLQHTSGDYIGIIDADLQQSPETMADMLKILQNNPQYDCVAAYQKERKEGKVLGFFKRAFYKIINHLAEVPFTNGASDFRVFTRKMADAMISLPEYFRFSKGLFSYVGFETYFYPYQAQPRAHGESKWSFRKLFGYAIEGIVSFSTAPLRFATILGLLFSAASFIYLIAVIIEKLTFGVDVAGYPTIVVLILLVGGIQLFALGIIGEYLGRSYMETKNRPVYFIRDIYTNKSDKSDT